jgi:FkbM family methyltransferase
VEEGEIGVSVVSPDLSEMISREERQAAVRTTEIEMESPCAGAWLMVRNTAAGGLSSRAKIHGIRAYRDPTEWDGAGPAIWLDVGAHLGEETFSKAKNNPDILVYAFEPNLRVASRLMGQLPNYVVLPFAITTAEGTAILNVNCNSQASSLLPMTPEGLKAWIGGENLAVHHTRTVPAMRLDTFMNEAGIAEVAYLKIDTQGNDLDVIRSAGERLRDIQRIKLEVQITPIQLYRNSCRKEEVIAYLSESGFELISSEKQTYDQEENLTFAWRAIY